MTVKPLTEEELAQLRALLLADARRQWLVSSLANVAKWIAVVGGGWLVFKGLMSEAGTWLGK